MKIIDSGPPPGGRWRRLAGRLARELMLLALTALCVGYFAVVLVTLIHHLGDAPATAPPAVTTPPALIAPTPPTLDLTPKPTSTTPARRHPGGAGTPARRGPPQS